MEMEVTKEEFYEIFSTPNYEFIGDTSDDLNRSQPHANFVYDNFQEITVGYYLSSSWGAEDQYFIFGNIIEEVIEVSQDDMLDQMEEEETYLL